MILSRSSVVHRPSACRVSTPRLHATGSRVAPLRAAAYTPPSSAVGGNELSALLRFSDIVPDVAPGSKDATARAATVSAPVLRSILSSERSGLKPYQVGFWWHWAAGRGGGGEIEQSFVAGVSLGSSLPIHPTTCSDQPEIEGDSCATTCNHVL